MTSDFRHDLGHVALDFVATVADRPGRRVERLADPSDLERWLSESGLATDPRVTGAALAQAHTLREAAYRLLDAARAGRKATRSDLDVVNEWSRRPLAAPQLDGAFRRSFVGPDQCVAALSEIARSTIDLVSGPEIERVRTCGGCSLLFLDRSRPGTRRWCSMERCGNRVKTARYRDKQRD